MPAAGALQQRCPHRPRFVVPASRTTKTLRPAELTQILSTGLLGGETRLELGQIPRIIFHFPDPTSCGHLSQVNTHLDPNKVVIVDTAGRVLARPGPDGDGFSGEQLEYRRKLEKDINHRVLATLEPYIGFDRVRSNAVAEVDWNRGEQTEEVLDPNTVVITKQRSEENARPVEAKGVPGTASSLPREPAAPEIAANSASRILETTNFQTSRTVTRLDLERGEVKRLSLAVLIDHRIEVNQEARELVRVARTPEEMEKCSINHCLLRRRTSGSRSAPCQASGWI